MYEFLKTYHNIHIPAVESYTVRDGKLVVLEDYVNGETLTAYLKRGIQAWERRQIVLNVCDALIFLHSAAPPIIHRDVKADNIVITPDHVVKLVDYDAATLYDPTKSADTVLMGTPGAAAPEQYGFGRSDERTDVFALGMLIRQILPNDAAYMAVAEKATKLDPQDRYDNVTEMKSALTDEKVKKQSDWFRPFREASVLKKVLYFLCLAGSALLIIVGFLDPDVRESTKNYWLALLMALLMLWGLIEIGFDMSGLIRRMIPEKYAGKKRIGIKFAIGAAYYLIMGLLGNILGK